MKFQFDFLDQQICVKNSTFIQPVQHRTYIYIRACRWAAVILLALTNGTKKAPDLDSCT